MPITLENSEIYTVKFDVPEQVNIHFDCVITPIPNKNLPSDYVEIVKEIIVTAMSELQPQDPVIPEQIIKNVYSEMSNVASVSVTIKDDSETPYTNNIFIPNLREIAVTTEDFIAVISS